MGSENPEVHEVHRLYATRAVICELELLDLLDIVWPCGKGMEAMVAKIDNTPFDKMEEKESLLLATPFGDKENGSNGS